MITDIQSTFKRDGSYTNQFDEYGNLIIVDSAEKYLAVTLTREVYENNSVSNIYTVDIEEFKDILVKEDAVVSTLKSEKTNLQAQINSLTSELSNMTNSSGKDALISASKDIIIGLRIKSGEGKLPSDFNTVFPYLPLKSSESVQSDASSTGLGSGTTNNTTTTTTTTTTTKQSSELTGAQKGLIPSPQQCERQADIQFSPPTELFDPVPAVLKPVAPVVLVETKPTQVMIPIPVHQIAVQKVVPPTVSCVQKYYPFGKYDNVWPAYGVGKSPMMYSYGVYSEKVGESFQQESSDTLSYQVYIPTTGTYTLKFAVDNSGYMAINGTRYIDLTKITAQSPYASQLENYQNDHPTTVQLTEGWNTIDLFYKNWGGPHSVAALISYEGRIIWTSRDEYNKKDYETCSGITRQSPTPTPVQNPSEDCINPQTIFKFTGNVDHTLRITLKGTTVTYSNEQYHGTLPRTVSEFSNNGVGPYSTNLTMKWSGRGSVQISQQPNSSNNYTAIIDIFDGRGGEGSYNLEVFQLKCSKQPETTSSGGAGGGCPAVWQLMETKELGVVEARHIKVGMHLKDSQPGVWNRVNVAYIAVAPIYRVDIDGQVFDVDHSHKWYLGNDNWVKVTDIKSGNYVETSDGTKVRVNSVHYLRDDQYMHMNVDNERYIMGTNIIGHNATDRRFLALKR